MVRSQETAGRIGEAVHLALHPAFLVCHSVGQGGGVQQGLVVRIVVVTYPERRVCVSLRTTLQSGDLEVGVAVWT